MIRVGASGWSHDDWVGPVYPVPLRGQPKRWLRAYAARLRTVELTSTFHAPAREDLVAAWSRDGVDLLQAGPFEFSLLMPREVTHDALPSGDVQGAWEAAARFERTVLEPLADEGLLGAVLLRVPPEVVPTEASSSALREILGALAGRSTALDLEHPAWSGSVHARDLLRLPDVCLVERPGHVPIPGARHTYIRLGETGGPLEEDELATWAQRARAHAAMGREVRVYFANATGGRAAADAVALLHLLGDAQGVPKPRLTAQQRLEL